MRTSAAALLGLAGCHDKSSPDNVDTRAVERWNLLAAHQAEKAWDYLTPGYRATKPRDAYAQSMNTRPVQWTGAKFKSKECDGDRCKVSVEVGYSLAVPGMAGKTTNASSLLTETWIRVGGEWYFLPN